MNERIYSVAGQVVDSQGRAWRALRVAVVDKDRYRDDLLGVGLTDDEGRFRLAFCESEFRQDLFETEEHPDLYLVFSVLRRGRYRTIARKDFFDLDLAGLAIELGEIQLDFPKDAPVTLPKQHPTPGYRVANRLRLSDELVTHCIEEVAPLVESLTGWPRLAEQVDFVLVDNMAKQLRKTLEEAGFQFDDPLARLGLRAMADEVTVLFEPFSRQVFIHASRARKQNLEAFKLLLGHELIHVGQFVYHPELLELHREHIHRLWEFEDHVDAGRKTPWQEDDRLTAYIRNLETYARYIQEDYLEKHYRMGTFFPERSLLGRLLQALAEALDPHDDDDEEDLEEVDELLLQAYREEERDGRPARFVPL